MCKGWASQVALVIKNLPANKGDRKDAGLIPGSRRFPGGGHGNPLQYSCLEHSMDRVAWWATVHRVSKSQSRLKQLSTHTCTLYVIIDMVGFTSTILLVIFRLSHLCFFFLFSCVLAMLLLLLLSHFSRVRLCATP